jgi:hypothetical protein
MVTKQIPGFLISRHEKLIIRRIREYRIILTLMRLLTFLKISFLIKSLKMDFYGQYEALSAKIIKLKQRHVNVWIKINIIDTYHYINTN